MLAAEQPLDEMAETAPAAAPVADAAPPAPATASAEEFTDADPDALAAAEPTASLPEAPPAGTNGGETSSDASPAASLSFPPSAEDSLAAKPAATPAVAVPAAGEVTETASAGTAKVRVLDTPRTKYGSRRSVSPVRSVTGANINPPSSTSKSLSRAATADTSRRSEQTRQPADGPAHDASWRFVRKEASSGPRVSPKVAGRRRGGLDASEESVEAVGTPPDGAQTSERVQMQRLVTSTLASEKMVRTPWLPHSAQLTLQLTTRSVLTAWHLTQCPAPPWRSVPSAPADGVAPHTVPSPTLAIRAQCPC
jgi:hypothetical protein